MFKAHLVQLGLKAVSAQLDLLDKLAIQARQDQLARQARLGQWDLQAHRGRLAHQVPLVLKDSKASKASKDQQA